MIHFFESTIHIAFLEVLHVLGCVVTAVGIYSNVVIQCVCIQESFHRASVRDGEMMYFFIFSPLGCDPVPAVDESV